jgi:hypothetical protein
VIYWLNVHVLIDLTFFSGYEGDSSDNEEGETGFNDLSGLQPNIPKFWLIMKVITKVKDLGVDVYFHARFVLTCFSFLIITRISFISWEKG